MSKKQIFLGWFMAYGVLLFITVVSVMLFAKFGVWMLLFVLSVYFNLSLLYYASGTRADLIAAIDNKFSIAIQLLAESAQIQSRELSRIHDWIKEVSYPKVSTKLH